MIVLAVALGAAVGAPLRYLTDRAVQVRHRTVFPWGTWVVNVLGSFVLGVVAGSASDPVVLALVGTGFCGALSTYSTFGYETVRLLQRRHLLAAVGNVLGSVAAGSAAVVLGLLLARSLG
jgi:fluoride exporter